jgi:hypothetical protein
MFPLLTCNVSGNKIVDLKLIWVIFGLTETTSNYIIVLLGKQQPAF